MKIGQEKYDFLLAVCFIEVVNASLYGVYCIIVKLQYLCECGKAYLSGADNHLSPFLECAGLIEKHECLKEVDDILLLFGYTTFCIFSHFDLRALVCTPLVSLAVCLPAACVPVHYITHYGCRGLGHV